MFHNLACPLQKVSRRPTNSAKRNLAWRGHSRPSVTARRISAREPMCRPKWGWAVVSRMCAMESPHMGSSSLTTALAALNRPIIVKYIRNIGK